MRNNIKEEFHSSTINVGLSFISLGIFGVIAFYFLDFPIIFSLMKSIFVVGILIFIASFFFKTISISTQDKYWIGILLLTVFFAFNNNFNISPKVLEDKLYEYEDSYIDSDIKILGSKKVKKIIATYNISDLIVEKQKNDENSVYDKNLIDIKNDVLSIYNDSLSTNKNKFDLYIDNIEIANVDKLINEIYIQNNIGEFNCDNIKNAKFIKNHFYYEESGIVVTGTLDIDNSIKLKIRPKNFIFKMLGF